MTIILKFVYRFKENITYIAHGRYIYKLNNVLDLYSIQPKNEPKEFAAMPSKHAVLNHEQCMYNCISRYAIIAAMKNVQNGNNFKRRLIAHVMACQ